MDKRTYNNLRFYLDTLWLLATKDIEMNCLINIYKILYKEVNKKKINE